MMQVRILVKKVRPFNSATVALVNNRGAIIPTEVSMSVQFPERYKGAFEEGSVWDVRGKQYRRAYRVKGRTITEDWVSAQQAVRICPEGPIVAYWIEKNVPGIGSVTATKLTRAIKNLDEVIRDGDVDALCAIDGMTATKAQELMVCWPDEKLYSAMRFLADCGLPANLADPITRIYKSRTEELIKADPYLLVSLGVSFEDVEALIARLELKVDPRDKDVAVAEESAHRKSMTGSTLVKDVEIKEFARAMGCSIADDAAEEAVRRGALIKVHGGYQTIGVARMEAIVGHQIRCFFQREPGEGALFAAWEKQINRETVENKLNAFEQNQLEFSLTQGQRGAVIGALLSPVACISGGAGVGKTTILKAILDVFKAFDVEGMNIHLMALSGRAAQRMTQSTNYPATTIAKHVYDYLRSPDSKKRGREDHALVVIDEASMVDLHTMYRLIGVLPEATRLLLVGDTAQLPPVGPGLIFHELVRSAVPTFHLTAVKRQAESSGIHAFATSVRNGVKPVLPALNQTLSESPDFAYSSQLDLENVRKLWDEAGRSESCIILAPTNTGEFGVDSVNAFIQDYLGGSRPSLRHMDLDGHVIPWRVKGRNLHLGDQVMVTANDYKNEIRNGDLATITQVFNEPNEEGHYGLMNLEGVVIPINDEVIEKLDLGFCVTIHKSQGSQWPVAIMLLSTEGELMTDRSLLYTGATRPVRRLVILGPESTINKAIDRGNFADKRLVAIQELLPKTAPELLAV